MAQRTCRCGSLRAGRADDQRADPGCRRGARVDAGDFQGERLEIGFNAEFLREGIESVEGDSVRLKLISPLRPGLLQGEEASFSYLIMPIRLST